MENIIIRTAVALAVIVTALVATGIREGKMLRYQELIASVPADADARRRAQRDWHLWGLVVRLLIVVAVVPFLYDHILLLVAYLHLSAWLIWVAYDGISNQFNALPAGYTSFWDKWWYSGNPETGAGGRIENKWGKYLPTAKMVFTAYFNMVILAIILYLVIKN